MCMSRRSGKCSGWLIAQRIIPTEGSGGLIQIRETTFFSRVLGVGVGGVFPEGDRELCGSLFGAEVEGRDSVDGVEKGHAQRTVERAGRTGVGGSRTHGDPWTACGPTLATAGAGFQTRVSCGWLCTCTDDTGPAGLGARRSRLMRTPLRRGR